MDTPERRVWGERRPKNRVTLQNIIVFTRTRPNTITRGRVNVLYIYIYSLQQDKCKCKKIGCVSVNDLHLHTGYRHLHAQHWYAQSKDILMNLSMKC